MPRTRKSTFAKIFSKNFSLQDSYANLILGAIIVVVLGLLVANYLTGKNQIGINQATPQEPNIQESGAKSETPSQEYKVVTNDSLSIISQKYYDSMDFWPVLARVNNITNPNLIYKDSILKIPAKADAEKIKTDMTVTSYKVAAGDTLFKIAEKVYGDGSKWQILDKANNVGRLPNGNPLIFAGNTLTIPR